MVTVAVLSAAADTVTAQTSRKNGRWSGEFSMSGGSNFSHDEYYDSGWFSRWCGEVAASLGYDSGKFFIKGGLNVSSDTGFSDGSGYTVQDEGDTLYRADVQLYTKETSTYRAGAVFEAGWKPDERNSWDFLYRYERDDRAPLNNVLSLGFDFRDTSDIGIGDYKYGITSDSTHQVKSTHRAGLRYVHRFNDAGRELRASLDMNLSVDDKYTQWALLGGTSVEDTLYREYRITPVYHDDELKLDVSYYDRNFSGVRGLDVDFSFRVDAKADIDSKSAANLIDGTWVDSTSYRENFSYYEYKPAPRVHVSYSYGVLNLELAYMPQFYLYHLSGDHAGGRLTMGSVSNFIDAVGRVRLWRNHTFSVTFNRDVKRPDYLQMCWFERGGAYADEIIHGNPGLRPTATNKASLAYGFFHGRFSGTLEVERKYEKDKIEGTFYTETRDDGHTYRIRTWANAAESYNTSAGMTLFWKGRRLTADIGSKFNYYYGIKDSGAETMNSDWSLQGDLSWMLKTWSFGAKLNYQSKIIRSYLSMTEIIGLNLKVEKKIGNFAVCIDGRNLLDKPVETMTESSDSKQGRYEWKNDNKRLILIGLKYFL